MPGICRLSFACAIVRDDFVWNRTVTDGCVSGQQMTMS